MQTSHNLDLDLSIGLYLWAYNKAFVVVTDFKIDHKSDTLSKMQFAHVHSKRAKLKKIDLKKKQQIFMHI